MKKIFAIMTITTALLFTSIAAEAKPYRATDSHGTEVWRMSLVEAKEVWNDFLLPGGLAGALPEMYEIQGLRYLVENPKTGELEYNMMLSGMHDPDELTREWDCVEYISSNPRYDGNVAMYKNRKNNTADVYFPDTAAF